MHWLNGYAEGFIRILKIATWIRLANLIGKYIDGELIKDATPWWPFAIEHARQCKAAEPSSSMTKFYGIVATPEQLFLSGVDTPTELNIHPVGQTCSASSTEHYCVASESWAHSAPLHSTPLTGTERASRGRGSPPAVLRSGCRH